MKTKDFIVVAGVSEQTVRTAIVMPGVLSKH